jgi:hypothetical protein
MLSALKAEHALHAWSNLMPKRVDKHVVLLAAVGVFAAVHTQKPSRSESNFLRVRKHIQEMSNV